VAARLRRELGIEVDEIPSHYGDFTVIVDGEAIRRGHAVAVVFGQIPNAEQIVADVRERLGRSSGAG